MTSIKNLRFLERFMLLIFVSSTFFLAKSYVTVDLEWNEIYAAAGFLVLLLFILLFIQRRFDLLLSLAVSQADFVQNDAFSSLYDRSPAAYLTVDKKGGIVSGNPAAIKLLQGEMDSIGGVNFFKLITSVEDEDLSVFLSKMAAGVTLNQVEARLSTLKGKEVWVDLSVNAYRNEGEILVSLVDVTAQKSVDTAKSEFVALATHQLRTPISAIRWNVELLQKNMSETKTEKQVKYLSKIDRNIMRMINLINDFLSVSKLEMGTFAASLENINMSTFFSSIADEFLEKITEKKISLNRTDDPPQLVIKTDRRLLHIVVSNLVSNAVKYLDVGGTLALSYSLKGEVLEFIVADNGIGIPEVELDKLFTKFFRASNAQSHQTEGTGLGLYIVKQSVEQLGGNISISTSENKGAKFIISIPVSVVSVG